MRLARVTLLACVMAFLFMAEPNEAEAQVGKTAKSAGANLAPSWFGNWTGLSIEGNGDFVIGRVRYKWIGSRSKLPRRAGCWAFYDGVTSKADWVLSFKRAKADAVSRRNLAGLNDERFKVVTVVCTDRRGQEIEEGADCIHSGFFKDEDVIYKPITCQIGDEFEVELRKVMRR